jgi:hypothetical protein
MFRKLPLLVLALAMSFASACASPAGLSRDDEEGAPEDSTSLCGVVGGSQTRNEDGTCPEPQDFARRG